MLTDAGKKRVSKALLADTDIGLHTALSSLSYTVQNNDAIQISTGVEGNT